MAEEKTKKAPAKAAAPAKKAEGKKAKAEAAEPRAAVRRKRFRPTICRACASTTTRSCARS